MRLLLPLAAPLLATMALAGTIEIHSPYPADPPAPPPAGASDLLRAQRQAQEARKRLEPPRQPFPHWVRNDPARR